MRRSPYIVTRFSIVHIVGEVIDAQKHDAVTMLFSDIVGFTSICSTATPFMVISMLQDLYTKFDAYCGQLDVYKVHTIYLPLKGL